MLPGYPAPGWATTQVYPARNSPDTGIPLTPEFPPKRCSDTGVPSLTPEFPPLCRKRSQLVSSSDNV